MNVKDCKDALGKSLYQKLRFDEKLPMKYIAFVAEYVLNGFNAADAYMMTVARKGSKREACYAQANNLIDNNRIQAAIKIVIDKWLGEKKLKLESEIIQVLYQRAFYDPSVFTNTDGSVKFKTWEDIPEEWRCVVDGIEKKYYGKDAKIGVTVLKLANREQAMRELSRYIELYKGSGDQQGGSLSEETVNRLLDVFEKKKE